MTDSTDGRTDGTDGQTDGTSERTDEDMSDRGESSTEATQGLTVALIAAVAENGVIGVDGEMPWHYPADLRHFKETTTGHPVIMGRRTYESIVARIGGPLPGRTNIVLSRREREYDDAVRVVDSVAEALSAAREVSVDDGVVYVIGGASVYDQFLPVADQLVITEVPTEPDGDTVFPAWDADQWREIDREREGELAFVTYERRSRGD
jgi:dihydrofolate reductase